MVIGVCQSVVIQSGEIESAAHTAFIEEVLRRLAPLELGVTLSLGEQTEEPDPEKLTVLELVREKYAL